MIAESNPDRMMSDTQAWQAHQKLDESVDIQKPLFKVNGFTAQQVYYILTLCEISTRPKYFVSSLPVFQKAKSFDASEN